jgi:two-component system alkaline phosphatase synthesis response regulator PhoP
MEGRILIIDDEESILDVLSECFILEDFQVKALLKVNEIVEVVNEIVEVVNDFKPDVLIIDYLLRGLNGGELCQEVKLAYPELPVAITSAYPKQMLSLARYNCDLFIAKPFDVFNVVEEVKQLIINCRLGNYKSSFREL